MKIVAFAAAVVASALCLTPAAGWAGPVEQVTRHIGYADLDLTTDSGRVQLDRRLGATIAEACGSASDLDLVGQNAVRRCRIAARQGVAAQRDLVLAAARDAAATRLALASQP